jgi:hypothetical protein
MNITDDHLKILVALRDASALRCAPTPGAPDGHQRMFSTGQLEIEGRLNIGPRTNAAARSLRKHTPYVAGRTLHTVTFYGITDEGRAYLAALEREAGADGLVAAELALEQAEADMRAAVDRYHQARAAHTKARREAGNRGSLNVVRDYLKERAL